eukprot:759697-Hanusia_phi.AAC.2
MQVHEAAAEEEVGGRAESHYTLSGLHLLPLAVLHVHAVCEDGPRAEELCLVVDGQLHRSQLRSAWQAGRTDLSGELELFRGGGYGEAGSHSIQTSTALVPFVDEPLAGLVALASTHPQLLRSVRVCIHQHFPRDHQHVALAARLEERVD